MAVKYFLLLLYELSVLHWLLHVSQRSFGLVFDTRRLFGISHSGDLKADFIRTVRRNVSTRQGLEVFNGLNVFDSSLSLLLCDFTFRFKIFLDQPRNDKRVILFFLQYRFLTILNHECVLVKDFLKFILLSSQHFLFSFLIFCQLPPHFLSQLLVVLFFCWHLTLHHLWSVKQLSIKHFLKHLCFISHRFFILLLLGPKSFSVFINDPFGDLPLRSVSLPSEKLLMLDLVLEVFLEPDLQSMLAFFQLFLSHTFFQWLHFGYLSPFIFPWKLWVYFVYLLSSGWVNKSPSDKPSRWAILQKLVCRAAWMLLWQLGKHIALVGLMRSWGTFRPVQSWLKFFLLCILHDLSFHSKEVNFS